MRIVNLTLLSLLVTAVSFYSSAEIDYTTQTRFLMDTYVTINVPVESDTDNHQSSINKALDRMQEVDKKFNHLNENSPIYSFNKQGLAITDSEILTVVKTALDISHETNGAFEPTMSPLINLWGFYSKNPKVPSQEKIDQVLKIINYKDLLLSEKELKKRAGSKAEMDLGAIAKGYAIKQAAITLKNENIAHALIDAGGDIYALGTKPDGGLWKVGIRDPHNEGILGYIQVENMAVVGSGDYERFFTEKGKKYHHIFNPKTGYPTKGLSAVTVVHPDPMAADAVATTIFVLGLEEGLKLVESIDKMETIIVTEEHEIHFSSGLQGALKKIA